MMPQVIGPHCDDGTPSPSSGAGRSAAEAFGEWHADHHDGDSGSTYRALVPAAPPRPGEQYRFEVDLDACTGCKSCVSACHSLNGLEESEIWRSVGLLVGGGGGGTEPVWQQHVTTACHHCVEPACLSGCPVDAYEKDPITGIVAHLDDQCIGCRYCQLTCPYEVPTFSKRLGVVRKCDMCSDRLAEGEAPACVQGCPTDAISIGIVSTLELTVDVAVDDPVAGPARVVPTAPVSFLTTPSTVYRTSRAVPANATAADDHRIVPASNHPPLVAMLVLTQLSVGAMAMSQLLGRTGGADAGPVAEALAWATAVLAIGASVLHLGRPLVAWRAVLGLRHSWLSREIVAFGAYAAAGGLTAAAAAGWLPTAWAPLLAAITIVTGLFGVLCSAELYAVTGRQWWRLDRTLLRFGITVVGTGSAAVGVATSIAAWSGGDARAMSAGAASVLTAGVVGAIAVALVGALVFVVRHRGSGDSLARTSWLLTHTLRRTTLLATAAALVGAVIAVALLLTDPSPAWSTWWWGVSLTALTGAAWLERTLFFTAAAPDRMPGGFH